MIQRLITAVLLIEVLLFGALIASCADNATGTLQGDVTIGPISPVENPGETPDIPCEVYQVRKVVVYDEDGNEMIKEVDIDCQGHYSAELALGIYLVDINRIGVDSSPDVPVLIDIEAGETTTLDIDIDTGIR